MSQELIKHFPFEDISYFIEEKTSYYVQYKIPIECKLNILEAKDHLLSIFRDVEMIYEVGECIRIKCYFKQTNLTH